ncbi:DUF624 domain-containing protein [Metabacillus idriensis]|uniref:DUF624 domain-containing protein n=1 Tax=Metabacillus idriensis TaxID=324768 RepID=UPI003D2DBEEB
MIKQLNQTGFFYKWMQYGYWFLVSNLYFSIALLPALVILMIEWDTKNILLWVLLYGTLLPVGPFAAALFGTMGKLMREGCLSVTSDFFRLVKENFKSSFILWSFQLFISLVITADLILLSGASELFISALYVLFIMNIIMMFYLYPLLSRFCISRLEAVRTSIGLTFLKLKNTLFIMSALAIWGASIYFFQIYAITLLISPFFYVIMRIHKKMFEEIEGKLLEKEKR